MIKIDAVGVTPETVTQILPSTPIARASCCSYLRVPVLCGLTADMEQTSFAFVCYRADSRSLRVIHAVPAPPSPTRRGRRWNSKKQTHTTKLRKHASSLFVMNC